MRLVLIGHAVPDVEPAYRAALEPFGPCRVAPFISPHPGMSSAYVSLAHALRQGGRILPALIAKYAPGTWDSVVLVTWSAAYALAREILQVAADVRDLDGLVMLDSLHCSSDPGARASQLAPFARYATLAQTGSKVLYVGHTDVPVADYYSTTRAAKALVELTGEPRGGFMVRAYDTVPGTTLADLQREHRNALRLWGPSAAAEAVAKLAAFEGGPATDRTPTRITSAPPNFGLAVLAVALEDLNHGIREVGHNAGPDIERLYLVPLRLPPGSNYCAAAFASWVRRAEIATGMVSPVRGSPGAKATRDQFIVAGLWTPASKLTVDDFFPGAVAVYDRSKPGPGEIDFRGHIEVIVDHGDVDYWTVAANGFREREMDDVAQQRHPMFGDPELLGIGRLDPFPAGLAA